MAKKMVVEKKTGEKYTSKAAMKAHEKMEGPKMRKMEKMMGAKKGKKC
jgi:hypothetical protein